MDEIEFQIQRAASALASFHRQGKDRLKTKLDEMRDGDVATIRACFAARGPISPDEFRRRVVDVAQWGTLTIEEGGREIMADLAELMTELRWILHAGPP